MSESRQVRRLAKRESSKVFSPKHHPRFRQTQHPELVRDPKNNVNVRDRSPDAEAYRKERSVFLNFLGFIGLRMWWTPQEVGTHARTKAADSEKERTAELQRLADLRRTHPFKTFFNADKMAEIAKRHIHPRHKRPVPVNSQAR